MKNLIIFTITITFFVAFYYFHYHLTDLINPNEMIWKQFSRDGTLIYTNSGKYFATVVLIKAFTLGIPPSIILIIKLRFITNNVRIAIKNSVLLNLFILLSGLMLGFIGIPFGNIYYSKSDEVSSIFLRDFRKETLAEFVHYFTFFAIVLANVFIAFLPKKHLQKLTEF